MMSLMVRVENVEDHSVRSQTFARAPVRIGRNPLNDLALEWPFVSQWHAVVQFDDGGITYYDLGSTNGTLADGQRLGKNVPVPAGSNQDFRIGSLRLTFALTAAQAVADAPRVNRHPSFAEAGNEHTVVREDLGSKKPAGNDRGSRAGGTAGTPLGATRGRIAQLSPAYESYRLAWAQLYSSLVEVLHATPEHLYGPAIAHFLESYPEAADEPEIKALAQSQGVALPGMAGASATALTLVTQLAQYLVPSREPPTQGEEIEGFLVRIATLLQAFGAAFVGLRKGAEEFGSEMAVSLARRGTAGPPTPIDDASDPAKVLEYLLDWRADGEARTAALRSSYADLMTHQVALLSGLMEGVRSLLGRRLAPAEIMRKAEEKARGIQKLWPFRAGIYWRKYNEIHDELTEDKEITSSVFGRDFARVYQRALGENFADNDVKRIGNGR